MHLKSKFLVIFLLAIQLSSLAQSKNEQKNEIGFACGVGGMPSTSVQKFTELIFHSNYRSVNLLLNSKIPAERYLAVITCERLKQLNLITLSGEDSLKINQVYHSSDSVFVCSGCTDSRYTTLEKLLTDKELGIKEQADHWLTFLISR